MLVHPTKTRIRFCLIAAGLWLSAAPAFGQQYNTLPPNSLVGNFRDQTDTSFAVTIPELIAKLSSNSIIGDNHQLVPGLIQGPLSAVQGHAVVFGASPNVIVDGGGLAGSGTLTEQKNTASGGIATSGNCDNTTSNAASPCDQHLVVSINAQTGTSYAIQDSDRAKLITASNASAQAYSIAQAGAASAFLSGWFVDVHNIGTNPAGIVTIMPTTSTIDGASTLKIYPGQSVRIVSDGTNYQTFNRPLSNATLQANPSNPTGTASATGVMMGLGTTCSITPVYSTRVRFEIIGSLSNSSAGAGVQPKLMYGTGVAPANGAAFTGTALGQNVSFQPPSANNQAPFALAGLATGLTPGTALWFDVDLVAGAGTASIASLSCNAMEF